MIRNNNRQGFTLVEVMIAATLGLLVMGMALGFFVETMRTTLGIDNNLDLDGSVRKIANEMADEARESNGFKLYATFYDNGHAISGSFRKPASGYSEDSYDLNHGKSGNFCVFYFRDIDTTPGDKYDGPLVRLVGYYLNVENQMMKFDYAVPAADAQSEVELVIPSVATESSHAVVLSDVNESGNEDLFYNLFNKSIMVNGKVNHGSPSKESSGLFNFTISPRG